MPSVGELSGLYENFMLNPRRGPEVCDTCFNFTSGYERCYACAHTEQHLDAVLPISYSVAHEQLHRALAGYKRLTGEVARRLTIELAAVLWRFLAEHERCLAQEAGRERLELVTTVPSSDPTRDEHHPLRPIVGEFVGPTRDRHQRLLIRSDTAVEGRAFDPRKYAPTAQLHGEDVLLVDDTWTTGANAQSAAAALKQAGAGKVAVVVMGRHLNREWHANDRRIRGITRPFDWSRCGLCS